MANPSYGKKVNFPVCFVTPTELVRLISKYEARILVLSQDAPKVIHLKQRGEYVAHYRAYQSKQYIREVNDEYFQSQVVVALNLFYAVSGGKSTSPLTEMRVLGATLTKADIEGIDRQVLRGNVALEDKVTELEYTADIDVVTNRSGMVMYGTLEFDGLVPYSTDGRMGIEGFLHLAHSVEDYVNLQPGSPIELVDTDGETSNLRMYAIGSPPVEGADFNSDFNNDFKIV